MLAAVRRFVQSAGRAVVYVAVLPRARASIPQGRVYDVRVVGVYLDARAARVLAALEHRNPSPAAIDRPIDASAGARPIGMTQDGREYPVGILRVDGEVRNLLCIVERQMHPRFAAIRRPVDAVSH